MDKDTSSNNLQWTFMLFKSYVMPRSHRQHYYCWRSPHCYLLEAILTAGFFNVIAQLAMAFEDLIIMKLIACKKKKKDKERSFYFNNESVLLLLRIMT